MISVPAPRNRLPTLTGAALLLLLLGPGLARAQAPRPPPSAPPAGDLDTLDLEQLMRIDVVVGASKREQHARDVASFVSVVTAAEIASHGYRTLADVLRTLPGFYVSYDRTYSHLGVRGFDRPGDHSTRVLVLLNGLRTNNNVFDEAGIGEEFAVDVDLVERVEVIRGPSAALYGSNAFFAVVNVVTRQGRTLNGVEVAASAASFDTYAQRASYGRAFPGDLEVLLSASHSRSAGQQLYFPEFDAPETNSGISEDGDGESLLKLFAVVRKKGFSFQASHLTRDKHDPTGSYGTVFNDPRTHTRDAFTLATVGYEGTLASGASVSARLHGGSFTTSGDYPFDLRLPPTRNRVAGDWWGADVDAARGFSRHYLTVGGEYRDNFRQDLTTYNPQPYAVFADIQKASRRWGLFAQDEIRILDPLTLYAGLRLDQYETFGSAVSPRLGLIYNPRPKTTLKLLAGRAFRAPNVYELYFEAGPVKANPQLQPEHIETFELVAQRFVGGGAQLSASVFRNRLSALITQQFDPVDARIGFENADQIESRGLELGLEVNRGHGATGQLTYSLQRTADRVTRLELTNSPRHLVKAEVIVPIAGRFSAGLDAQYLSTRLTLAGNRAHGYTVTNLSVHAPGLWRRLDLSATLYNAFNARYGSLGSAGYRQDVIAQDGRSFRVKTTLRF